MAGDMRPNILYVMSDDHAAHALICYGSRVNTTVNLDRLGEEGMRFENCFCTNAICTPSRAVILTGLHSHRNGVLTLFDDFDGRRQTFPKLLQSGGYQTALVGKWHLGHGGNADPTGFDYWNVLPGQGDYFDPKMFEMGEERHYPGYTTELITDLSLRWLGDRDRDRPFLLLVHHKAPHRPWQPSSKYASLYEDDDLAEPPTFDDDYATRSDAARNAKMRIDRDLTAEDLKGDPPDGLSPAAEKRWKYQRYMKDYLRCVASVDESMGRLLDYLDAEGMAENTIVVYTSDQGFFLGDHGWYDKRFMYEESLRMPLLVRYPPGVGAGSSCRDLVTNLDFAPTLLDLAGVAADEPMQGRSFRPLLEEAAAPPWDGVVYYRYWEHLSGPHEVVAHYGIRTARYKLIYYYGEALGASGAVDEARPPEWELFDLVEDPAELRNVYHDPAYASVVAEMTGKLHEVKEQAGDDA
ncbi:MAG: sulfatase family protein [Acidimicrobiales bacterium]